MNKNLRKAMISAICMLIVGVMSLTGVTYAWFTQSEEAIVSGMSFNVMSPAGGVLISDIENDAWRYSIELTNTFDNFAPTSTAPENIVNGELKFYNATVDTTVAADKLGKVITTGEVGDGAYFKKTIYMWNDNTENAVSVNLAGTVIGINDSLSTAVDKGAQTAMRLALVKHGSYEMNAGATLTTALAKDVVIYEPYADTRLDGTAGQQKLAYRGITGESATPFDSTADDCQYSAAVSTVVSLTDPALTIEVPAGQCYAVTVYIWLEGQDADCVNAIGGTNLSAELHFAKVQ